MNVRMVIWVTSVCNLRCKWCNQQYVMDTYSNYHMSQGEVDHFVQSCKDRGIRFAVIELTGGEPSLWANLEYGVRKFQEIADQVILITNGNDTQRILDLGLSHFVVSASQANEKQLEIYRASDRHIIYNQHQHKLSPTTPVPDSLPADCCADEDPFTKEPQNSIEYILGKVYYCCGAVACSEYAGMTEDLVCNFEDDFIIKFSDKKYDKAICQYCLCNNKVWHSIE